MRNLTTRWHWLLGLALAMAGCATLESGASNEREPPVPAQLQERQVIVTLAPASPERWATVRGALAQAHGLRDVGAFPLASLGVQCVVFQVPPDRSVDEVVKSLAADPLVESVQPNQVFLGLGATHDDPYASLQYGIRAIHADLAHRWATGKGVQVAVVDTGADTNHPDLRNRIVKSATFVAGGAQTFADDSHGTAVVGVIAAVAGNDIGIVGVAPEADIVVAKACWHRRPQDLRALCSSWSLAKAVDSCVSGGAKVLNLSLGGPPDPLLARLIERAVDRGVTVVAAAAMEQGGAAGFPASLDGVIAVVASDPDDAVRAPSVPVRPGMLAAPGVDVLTTAPHGAYDFRSGSSVAAAHVSGVVALLLERDPGLTPAAVRAVLLTTARPGPMRASTAAASASVGRVDACAALAKIMGATGC